MLKTSVVRKLVGTKMTLVILLMVMITFFAPDFQLPMYRKGGENGNDDNNVIPIFSKGLTSKAGFQTLQYHDLDFCQSEQTVSSHGTLQHGMFGPRIPYLIKFLENRPCDMLCIKLYNGGYTVRQKLDDLKRAISLDYEHRWFVDKLPVKWCYSVGDGERHCRNSFPMGCHVAKDKNTCAPILRNTKNDTYYLFNHVDLELIYHNEENEKAGANIGRILFVEVKPASINHRIRNFSFGSRNCDRFNDPMELPTSIDDMENFHIAYTFSLNFYKNNTMEYPLKWARIADVMFD